jgi:hypothetical protein
MVTSREAEQTGKESALEESLSRERSDSFSPFQRSARLPRCAEAIE